jgi:hypothetical protein
MNSSVLIWGIAGVLGGGFLLWLCCGGKNEKLKNFSGRENLSLDQIFDLYFKSLDIPKIEFVELWNELADVLEIPAGLLRPEDRFSAELAPEKGNEWDDPIGLIPSLIEKNCKKREGLPPPDFKSIDTVSDYIRIIAQAMHT